MEGVADLPKTNPFPSVFPRLTWSIYVDEYKYKYTGTRKLGSAGAGGVVDSKKHDPSPACGTVPNMVVLR